MPGGMFPGGQGAADREKAEREHQEAMRKLKAHNDAQLAEWRKGKLVAAGFSATAADLILSWPQAGHLTEEALALIKKGCPPATALDIIRPDALPVSGEA